MKITFELKDTLYKGICDIDEYIRQSPEWQHRAFTSLDDVINFVLDQGWGHFSADNPEFQVVHAM